ncbi:MULTISPECIES: TIGR02530 family flagellar biosynthesis protein [Paenibacillus]|uniref:Flagellar biosynthesis protein n=1 Tax=Paenibacillus naphthalenovorans TaxID=162209 RepID=A0A0U2VQ55_9BACL|nr:MULTISPECIES: TIGR02530 family flagellar biosynthesis protein [Paenibacillus]ALS21639.1 flagellar biosynthesis protein [Paenibacillus naphthalenovorans]NTZ18207.1 flagellar biosynthesis protein [Paenibacillus sp. JMULE4]GCL71366.1 flagellar biosynthesis protein [Paenibacillus naphthalenovorans]SDI87210.1 flagellar operon protein [Paenibacillus naphthalenovorans]
MTERITIGRLYPNVVTPNHSIKTAASPPNGNLSFDKILQKQTLRFSHHAEERLRQRGIQFQPEHLAKINSAIDKAATKGMKESLMLIDDTALIVNIKSRTVVTAMDEASMKDNLFTQIDSAIIIS